MNDVALGGEAILSSPWRNSYWFARMLLNTDQYGALGKKEDLMGQIISEIEAILPLPHLSDEEKYQTCVDILDRRLRAASRQGTKAFEMGEQFADALVEQLKNILDIVVFVVTAKYIVLPTNAALARIPNDDIAFCRQTAANLLNTLGRQGVGKILSVWDSLGVRGCLDVERTELIQEFTKLRTNLTTLSVERGEIEDNAILTGFVQEFERRAGQKRKSRAGGSLEDIATFLFDYYGFSSHPKPDHFQTDIEVDKWFKCKDGWSIGISCKRTLRERWKQVSSADANALSRYKIKEIWHLTTYDRDLSDDKLTMLGQQRQIFYLDDAGEKYKYAASHVGMKDYVRPLSRLIDDIAKEQGRSPAAP